MPTEVIFLVTLQSTSKLNFIWEVVKEFLFPWNFLKCTYASFHICQLEEMLIWNKLLRKSKNWIKGESDEWIVLKIYNLHISNSPSLKLWWCKNRSCFQDVDTYICLAHSGWLLLQHWFSVIQGWLMGYNKFYKQGDPYSVVGSMDNFNIWLWIHLPFSLLYHITFGMFLS